jgi:hypothetical protein
MPYLDTKLPNASRTTEYDGPFILGFRKVLWVWKRHVQIGEYAQCGSLERN